MTKRINVDITPDKSLIKKLGLTGYRTEQAVAELVDNSIDSRIEGKRERIDVKLDFDKRQITVEDNGQGMNFDELKNALTIAKETKKKREKLDQFGLGMKSACSSLGKSFELVTTKPNSKLEFTARYDEERWLSDKSEKWTNFEIKKSNKKKDWHGTRIIISKLKIPLYPNQLSNFKKRFGAKYGPHLQSKQIRIRVNSRDCKSVEPELKEGTKETITIKLPSGNQITGWIGLLERRSVKGDYGIHLYRKKRLIKTFDKFGITHHPQIARIIGEISLDHIPVNFHKTGFLEDSLEYKEAVTGFKNDLTVVKILRNASSQKQSTAKIQSVFEPEMIPEKPINTRISDANAKSLLLNADNFTIQNGSLDMNLEFQDTKEGIYQMERSNDKVKVTLNKSSDTFKAFKNPLFLLGWIRIEAELMANDPSKYATFINERNRKWNEFVRTFLPKPKIKKGKSKEKIVPLPNYSLEDEFIELHDHLKENFEHDFQFTGLSTLTPFLQNTHNKIIYNIQTVNGAGQELFEIISDHTKFIVLLDPKPVEIETILKIAKYNKFIIIREYAGRLSSTLATPEKAWLDLYFEVKKNKITLYSDELIIILDELLESNLINPTKLRSLARHRKLLDEIEIYL